MRIAALIVLCVLAFPVAAASQQNFDTVQVRTQKVADGVYMLIGAGGNIGLAIGDDAVFVVDDQYAPLTRKVLACFDEVAWSDEKDKTSLSMKTTPVDVAAKLRGMWA